MVVDRDGIEAERRCSLDVFDEVLDVKPLTTEVHKG
jgi:hypothetical protein